MKTIAILGLGAMGSRMTRRLLAGGQQVIAYNRTEGPGAELAALGAQRAVTPRAAAERADVVVSCVTDDEASRSIWLDAATGALAGLSPRAVAIESSTLTPDWVRDLDQRIRAHGAAFLEAPVSGSRPQADAGELIYLVGGEVQTLERVRDTLALMGSAIHHVGPVGTGTTMKLAVNALLGIEIAALAEVLDLARRHGIAPAEAHAIIAQTTVASPVIKLLGKLLVEQDFAPRFPIDLVRKDLRYATTTMEQRGGKPYTIAAARDAYDQASAGGHGADNITAIAKIYAR